MPGLNEIVEKVYKKLKPYENPEIPLAPTSVRIAGGCGNLQKMLNLLEDLPKISREELKIEKPDYSQFLNLKASASATFKIRTAEYLSQWGIEFIFKISVSRNLYEALIIYVDKHGLVDE